MSKKTKMLLCDTSSLSATGKKKMREAIYDIKKGRVSKVYDKVDEMIKNLDS